jgi:hypothetical protein
VHNDSQIYQILNLKSKGKEQQSLMNVALRKLKYKLHFRHTYCNNNVSILRKYENDSLTSHFRIKIGTEKID